MEIIIEDLKYEDIEECYNLNKMLQSLLSLQERNFFQSYLEVSSHLLQTLLVLLSRLLRRTRKLLNQFNTELTMKAA